MSEVYCRACENDIYDCDDGEFVHIPKDRLDSPAILTNVTQRRGTRHKPVLQHGRASSPLNSDTKYEISTADTHKESSDANRNTIEDCELGDDVVTNSESLSRPRRRIFVSKIDTKNVIRVRGKEELPVSSEMRIGSDSNMGQKELSKENSSNNRCQSVPLSVPILASNKSTSDKLNETMPKLIKKPMPNKVVCTNDHPLLSNRDGDGETGSNIEKNQSKSRFGDYNKNREMAPSIAAHENISIFKRMHQMYSTLPKMKRITAQNSVCTANRPPFSIPMRRTSDGTTIYYLCDLPKNVMKGGYNFIQINQII